MTTKESNQKVRKLFNEFKRKHVKTTPKKDDKLYWSWRIDFRERCKDLHRVVGLYEGLTDKNALKMASICSTIRFVEPWEMLMKLQHTTNIYH